MDLMTRVIKMGITSYKEKSSKSKEEAEKLRATAELEVVAEEMIREVDALLPPKQEDTAERDGDVYERFTAFMKAGGCKEPFKALQDCIDDETQAIEKCTKHLPMLKKCMDTHSDYYQPIITLAETTLGKVVKVSEAKDVAAEGFVNWVWAGCPE